MEIKIADNTNFSLHSLASFDRFQSVNRVFRLKDGKLTLETHPFTETWSAERKAEKAAEILSGRYITYCAFEQDQVIGEIMFVPEPDHGRLIIQSFHVSRNCRRRGIGRALLAAVAAEARNRGASALYASACSAEETILFYLAAGFVPTENPIAAYAEEEPCDIQMECALDLDAEKNDQ